MCVALGLSFYHHLKFKAFIGDYEKKLKDVLPVLDLLAAGGRDGTVTSAKPREATKG